MVKENLLAVNIFSSRCKPTWMQQSTKSLFLALKLHFLLCVLIWCMIYGYQSEISDIHKSMSLIFKYLFPVFLLHVSFLSVIHIIQLGAVLSPQISYSKGKSSRVCCKSPVFSFHPCIIYKKYALITKLQGPAEDCRKLM